MVHSKDIPKALAKLHGTLCSCSAPYSVETHQTTLCRPVTRAPSMWQKTTAARYETLPLVITIAIAVASNSRSCQGTRSTHRVWLQISLVLVAFWLVICLPPRSY